MIIKELSALSSVQVEDVLALMKELTDEVEVTTEMLLECVRAAGSHFFAVVDDSGHIVGCATLCVYDSPTGKKASVEDVVMSSACRGQGLGRLLMEHVIDYARRELGDVDIHLTSRPHRVQANELYQRLGFEKRVTNAYVLKLRAGE